MFRKLRLSLFLILAAWYSANAQAPVASISASVTSGCPGTAISFNDASTNNPTSWSWIFPGGTPSSSTLKNPSVLFNTAGMYTVTLVSKNASGTSNTASVQITINPPPVADFTQDKTTGCAPTNVQFTNTSTPGTGATITSYAWTFGDGTQDTVTSPNHRYTLANPSPGFPVTLYVKNSFGCQGSAQIKNVQKAIILTGTIIPNFSSSLNSSCNFPVTASFSNSTTGPAVLSYSWDFGDGSPKDNTLSPTHGYTVANNYIVKLAVSSSQGCNDTVSLPVNITASGNLTDFTYPDTVCVNTVVDFKNISSPFPNSSDWTYGDGQGDINKRNGQHTYTVANTYNVTLVNTFAGCGGSVTRKIVVVNPPVTSFTGTNITNCKPPLTSTFTNTTTGASSYIWDFGDGSPKYNGQTPPPHTFTAYGNFNVNLMSSSAAGCSTNSSVTVYVTKPTVKIMGLPGKGCAPYTFTPTASSTTVDGVTGYSWVFGNGNTSLAQNPPPQTYTPGTYKVYLTITTSGGCTAIDSGIVTVGTIKPTPAFTFIPPSACAQKPVAFTDGSSAGTNDWLWEFGDGSTDNVKNPTYSYPKPGTYSVRLTAYNNGCWDTISHTIVVAPPLAEYKVAATCGKKNSFSFTDASTGPVTTWFWDFKDGQTYNGQFPPTHTFPAGIPKTYDVELTVTDGACSSTIKHPITVNQSTTITFSTSPVCVNTPIFITANAPGTYYSYEFDFGDGTTLLSTSSTVAYNYTKANNYQLRVITYDNVLNCRDTSAYFPLTVNGPTAKFAPTPTLSCKALNIAFQDQSTAFPTPGSTIVKWAWDFGDGGTSTVKNPNYTYAIQGNFVPRLTVTDDKGCTNSLDTAKPITISLISAGFTVADTNSCPNAPLPVKFNNTSTGGFNPVYNWDFGDGVTSNLVSPTHAYAGVGKDTAKLVITDTYGCSVPAKSIVINVDAPLAQFTMSGNYSACPVFNDTFTFTGHYAKTYAWDFKDGGISQKQNPVNGYALPGDYFPFLTIVSPGGCISTSATQQVHIDGPVGTFTYSPLAGCDSLLVNFNVTTTNVVSFTWFFGDGSDSVNTIVPTQKHKYTVPGQYSPIVFLTDAGGCRLSKIGQDFINVDAIPKPYFAADKIIVCDTGTVKFTDSSTLGNGTVINNYIWDFGDGTAPVSGLNPVIPHKFNTLGNDSVAMSITSVGGCNATYKKLIAVVPSPNVSINGLVAQCEPALLTFSGNEITPDPNGPLQWSWDFGNGKKDVGQNPANVAYPKAGDYVIQLVATNTKGCKTMPDTTAPNNHLRIYPIPAVYAGPDTTVCIDLGTGIASVQLIAGGQATTYNWLPPVAPASLSCTNCNNPIGSSPSTTLFILKGTSPQGCSAKDTLLMTVNVPPVVNVSDPDSVCLGQSTQLVASGAAIYAWTPAQGLSNPNIANPMATPDAAQIGTAASAIINYQVTGYDSKKCFSDIKSVNITAFNYPVIDMVPNATINVGSTYQINASVSTNILSLNWSPSNTLSCANCLTPIAKPTKTTKYLLSAVNDGGCMTTDSFNLQVICNGANFFVPNSFSPNGDGVNDHFIVNGTGLNMIPSITIYNRWGQIVFQKSGFAPNSAANAWDGTFNGQPAPADVYIYTIQILCDNATLIPYHGNVTLIR